MLNILRVLGASARTQEVLVLERKGRHLRLQSLLPILAGTVGQIRLDGELLLGEVNTSIPRSGHFEVGVQLFEALQDSWHAHQDWRTMDSEKSVSGSLAALNASLSSFDKVGRAGSE